MLTVKFSSCQFSPSAAHKLKAFTEAYEYEDRVFRYCDNTFFMPNGNIKNTNAKTDTKVYKEIFLIDALF